MRAPDGRRRAGRRGARPFALARQAALAATLAAVGLAPTRAALAAPPPTATADDPNPAAPGFRAEASDPRAIAVADRAMLAMGGRRAWDETRYLTWSFFGARRHAWDKWTGDARVEGTRRESGEPFVILLNVGTGAGRAWSGGREVTDEPERDRLLAAGKSMWINDSYWLLLPYKLKDTGVALRWLGEQTTAAGAPADALELTFEDVGETPENRYVVRVGKESGLVEEWEFYREREDAEPAFVLPWTDWKRCGRILLSGGRGERSLSEIAAPDSVPRSVFESPAPVDWDALLGR